MGESAGPEDSATFSLLLRRKRLGAGLTQAALAERAGVSTRGIQHLEAGLGQPHPDTTQRLADALGLAGEGRSSFEAAASPAPRMHQVRPQALAVAGLSSHHNLPVPVTSFVGRERELADVKERLQAARLLTLVGAGGSGKTRLALEVARSVMERYPAGIWLVEFASLADASLVPNQVAGVLGVREGPVRSIMAALLEALHERHLLLVLDNCEHLVQACAELADGLLSACPSIQILATSREVLGIAGEAVWRIPPLSVPSFRRRPADDDQMARYEGVRLFVERAAAVSADFELTSRNAAAIAEICSRLDGIPLAIELAAARVPVLSVEDISARLDDRLRLLTGGSRTALPRHRTLRGTLDWSYALLSGPERILLDRLAVFAGGWTLEAAEAVSAGNEIAPEHVLDLVAQLVAKSMVVVEEATGNVRYRMVETIRQYAAEKLAASADERAVRSRHLEWFLRRADLFEASLDGPNQATWLDRMEADVDNLRAALQWSKLDIGQREPGLRLGAALSVFWWRRGHAQEGSQHLDELLNGSETLAGANGRVTRTRALTAAGFLLLRRGAPAAARPLLTEALSLARALEDKRLIGIALTYLGEGFFREGDSVAARPLLEEALQLAREVNGWLRWYIVLMHLGWIAEIEGGPDRARTLYREGLDLGRRLKDAHFNGLVLQALGSLELNQGNLSAARACLEESLLTFGSAANSEIAQVLASFAGLAAAESEPLRALRLAGGTQALRRAQGAALQPMEQARLDRQLDSAMRALDDATAQNARLEGESMTLEELVAYALESHANVAYGDLHSRVLADFPRVPSDQPQATLTLREFEVVDLLARGLTNREIAAELVISEGTAQVHVKHILGKLGFTSRGQITAWALTERTRRRLHPTIATRRLTNT